MRGLSVSYTHLDVYKRQVYAGIFPFSVGKSIVVCIPAYSSSADGVFTVCKPVSYTHLGFLNGTQTKLKYVPEQDTDFIFCTVGEEEGFVGSTAVLLLLSLIHI